MAISSVQDVKDKLITKGIDSSNIKDGDPYTDDYSGATIHRIYFRKNSDILESKTQTVELKEEGNIFKYFREIPSILREPTTPDRTPLFSDADIKTEIEKKYALLKDDSFSVRVSGDEDRITARVIDPKDSTAMTTAEFLAYDNNGTLEIKEVK